MFAALLLLASCLANVAVTIHRHGRLPVDNSLEIWFLEDDPALLQYRAFLDRWGNDEAVVIALFDPQGVLRAPTLDLVAELSAELRALPRVESVTSLATVTPVRNDAAGDLVIERHYQAPLDPADLERVQQAIRDDALFRDHLLSPDERAAVLSVQLEVSDDFDAARKPTLAAIRALLDARVDGERRWAWGGIGVIHVALNDLVVSDSRRFSLWTNVILIVGLWVVFRRALAVVACLLSVGCATLTVIGVYLASGLTLNMVTMVLPTLVMVVGLTDAVYFVMSFQQLRAREPELEGDQAVIRALGFCFWPGLFNSLTTSVGFLAFTAAPMAVVRHLGVFAGVGIAAAFVSSLVVCSVLLARWPDRFSVTPGRWSPPLEPLGRFVVRRRRPLVALSLLALGLAAIGVAHLRVDSYSLAYFYDDHEIRRHDRALLEAIGPYLPLELVLQTGAPDGVKRPDVLAATEDLIEQVIAAEDGVGNAIGLPRVARRLHRVLNDDPQAALPQDPEVIEQELLFYDPERPDDPVLLVDGPTWENTRFTFKIENRGALEGRLLLDRIHARAGDLLPDDVELLSGGYMPLYARLIDHLVRSQVLSISITLLVITCMVAALFRSARYALVSLLPNVLPVAATLGLMAALGIRLDVATVLVASVALGVAVDDTIHFLYKFRAAYELSGDPEQAAREALNTTGRAILSTSLVVSLGFSALGLASIKTVALFGLLLAAAMLFALVAELWVTPALLCLAFPTRPAPNGDTPVTG